MNNQDLLTLFNDLLKPWQIKDYCPNGLQVEGKAEVNKVVTGVTASQALIDAAISKQADAIFVHHGYFWKGENPTVTGMKRNRFKALLTNDINLYAYHLPLDIHPEVGNNAQLAKLLGIDLFDFMTPGDPLSVGNIGKLAKPTSLDDFVAHLTTQLDREPLVIKAGKSQIETVAVCTGGAQGYIDKAAELNADLYISGEISEQTTHSAVEQGINYIAAGHHATERYGAKAVAAYLQQHTNLDVEFIDIDNPA